MSAKKMHDGEADVDAGLVRRLLAAQLPEWCELPLRPVESTGTVNVIYRLGDDLCVRLPRTAAWAGGLRNEQCWLPVLAPRLPLAVPAPVAAGEPDLGYPFSWAVYEWLEGETFARDRVDDERDAAAGMAGFVSQLRRIPIADAPASRRDRPLRERDAESRAAIDSLHGVIDTGAALAAWEATLRAPDRDGDPVWTHGDLLPPNVLVRDGWLRAVLDFGNVGTGDPAVDVIPAWTMFGRDGRSAFRDALGVDDATWLRARGFALHQALLIIPYYAETNPELVAMAERTVVEVLADSGG